MANFFLPTHECCFAHLIVALAAAPRQARTRKECIRSSARVYRRLLRFTPGASVLQFDVIGALAYDDGGDLDEKHAQSLLKLFQPDKDELLSQLSFLQSVDHVYKQLRFLRASILNSSKIDSVLVRRQVLVRHLLCFCETNQAVRDPQEDVFDVLFYGMLAILVMTLLGLNPWPLLVSFSTLMVSFAFSFGPSCAKYIEVCVAFVAWALPVLVVVGWSDLTDRHGRDT